jgi:hypothetical protein
VGTVDAVVRVPTPEGWPNTLFGAPPPELIFGRIRVERVLKGDPSLEVVWHEAWRTWACDTTRALEGRRALYLLGSSATDHQSDSARAAVARHLGPELVLRNLGSGDGLLPITVVDEGIECVYYGNVPADLDLRRPGPFQKRPHAGRLGTQSLETISAWIAELARFPDASCVIRMQSAGLSEPVGEAFDARFLADGSYRVSIADGRQQRVRSGRIEAAAWEALLAAVERASAIAAPLAHPSAAQGRRNLTVRLGGADRRWSYAASAQPSSGLPPDSRAQRNALLTAWALVRGAIDCSECADHRAVDERAVAR